MRRYYLVFETGSLQKTIYPLLEATTIGRDTNNAIRLTDATASRNHARVRFWQGSWMMEDVGSTNGIIVNGERIAKASLKPGSSFKIGQTIFTLIEREIAKSKDPLHTTLLVLSRTIEGVESPAIRDGTDRRSGRLLEVIAKIPFFVPLRQESATSWQRPRQCTDLVQESSSFRREIREGQFMPFWTAK
jgi:hypothetical protein